MDAPSAEAKDRNLGIRVGILACLLARVVVAVVWFLQKRVRAIKPIRSIAVLPLQNLSGDSQEYFGDGMTDELITELARIPNLRVVSRTSVMRDKGSGKSLRQIAQELGVDAIIEGSVVRANDRVRITAQLIDARDDRHLWAQSLEGHLSDVLSLQEAWSVGMFTWLLTPFTAAIFNASWMFAALKVSASGKSKFERWLCASVKGVKTS